MDARYNISKYWFKFLAFVDENDALVRDSFIYSTYMEGIQDYYICRVNIETFILSSN